MKMESSSDNNPSVIPYNDTPYLHATSNLPVPGLFGNFHTAATLLRVARSELKVSLLEDGERIVSDFYNLLQQVEVYIDSKSSKEQVMKVMHEKFIVEIEGLDGSGKTSLVQGLAEAFKGEAMKTPSPSLSAIRPLWDHRGGILARAFYFVTNYVLEYEITSGLIGSTSKFIVIDRWYASTLAYTVAYRPDDENFQMKDLPKDIFQWPSDLFLRPHLMLLLDIDPETRQARVEGRKLMGGGASRFNPWDDRLDNDQELGRRIMTAMKNITGPQHTHVVNANGTKSEVLNDSLEAVRVVYKKAKHPESYYEHDPLMWWRHDGMQLGLCNEHGYRESHALWNLQLAYDKTGHPPVLKTVGLHHMDTYCIYYWSSSSFMDRDICNNGVTGSVLCLAGSYPLEYQWRAEGFFTKVTTNECILYGYQPPNSLLRHVAACEDSIKRSVRIDNYRNDRRETYDEFIQKHVNANECTSSTISFWRFTPIRIEVLRGGPSTRIGSYPTRWEWIHKDEKWSMRSILPFTPSLQNIPRIDESWKLKNCTIAFVGTHCSGKTTIGNRLSELLGWYFDEELGKILRDEDSLVANGHLIGGGDGINSKDQWDELIMRKECERDNISTTNHVCRVVETWHCGNAAWNYFRRKGDLSQNEFRSTVLQTYIDAMKKHVESTSVLMVFLSIDSANTIISRRLNDHDAMKRLPLEEECEDAKDLLCLNEKEFYEYMAAATNIPFLVVGNTDHGEEAIEKTLKSILYFTREHAFRRVDIKQNTLINNQ